MGQGKYQGKANRPNASALAGTDAGKTDKRPNMLGAPGLTTSESKDPGPPLPGPWQHKAYSPEGCCKEAAPDRDPWKHRSTMMTCRTCMAFAIKAPVSTAAMAGVGPRGRVGRCRQNAPTHRGYPVVFESDWCMQHKLDENSL